MIVGQFVDLLLIDIKLFLHYLNFLALFLVNGCCFGKLHSKRYCLLEEFKILHHSFHPKEEIEDCLIRIFGLDNIPPRMIQALFLH